MMVLPRPDFEERYLDVGKGILAREKDIIYAKKNDFAGHC
jgi:hypothetical protein